MGVGIQVIIIMFDDNQIIVVVQCVISINNVVICGCDNCLFFVVCDINFFVVFFRSVKGFDYFVFSWLVSGGDRCIG